MFQRDALVRLIRAHMAEVRRRAQEDAGYTTETVIVTALLAILGVTVVGIIVAKVIGKATGIDLG